MKYHATDTVDKCFIVSENVCTYIETMALQQQQIL